MIGIGLLDRAKPHHPLPPLYQQVLIVVLAPPIMSAMLCFLIKARGRMFGTSNSRVVRNASDRIAFLTFTVYFYVMAISIAIYAHYARR
jgi:hypothetical protein